MAKKPRNSSRVCKFMNTTVHIVVSVSTRTLKSASSAQLMFSFRTTNKLLKIPDFEKLARQDVAKWVILVVVGVNSWFLFLINISPEMVHSLSSNTASNKVRGDRVVSVHQSIIHAAFWAGWWNRDAICLCFFSPGVGGGGGCIEMSSARGNHLGLSKVQRMLPLQRLKGSRRMWVWEAVQLGRSLVPWVLARWCVIADEFRAVTD